MTAHLALGNLTTELVSVLATQTGLAVGDGVAPTTGVPSTSDYPYVVVYEVAELEQFEMLAAPSTTRMEWQCSCVGLTRAQAARARDFCKVILDPTIAVATADAKLLNRTSVLNTMDASDAGKIWTAVWRFEAIVTAA